MIRQIATLGLCMSLVTLAACSSDDDDDTNGTDPGTGNGGEDVVMVDGLISTESSSSTTETIAAVETAIGNNDAVSVVTRLDHMANAESVGLELRPTELILFGNPALGTQLMQINQVVGLDLPQKLLAWEDAEGTVQLSFNDTDYLVARHGVGDATDALGLIDGALQGLTANATAGDVDASAVASVAADEGIILVESANSVDDTYNALVAAVEAAPPLTVIAEVDHAANAASVGLELRPTRLLVFGNPNNGTPLMQAAQTAGIDLPVKFLVFEAESGQVSIAYNDPAFIASRHGISGQDELIGTIATALNGLATAAATAPN